MRDTPPRVPDEITAQQWLNDLNNVGEVWVTCHTEWGYKYPYSMGDGPRKPFVDGDLIDRQGLFGGSPDFVSVKAISSKLTNFWNYKIHDYYTGHREVQTFYYEDDFDRLWSVFSFSHPMSSVYLDSCYSGITSLPMAFGIIPGITYGSSYKSSCFGWAIAEEFESGYFSPLQVKFTKAFSAAYMLDSTVTLGMGQVARLLTSQCKLTAEDYRVLGNPQHPYARH